MLISAQETWGLCCLQKKARTPEHDVQSPLIYLSQTCHSLLFIHNIPSNCSYTEFDISPSPQPPGPQSPNPPTPQLPCPVWVTFSWPYQTLLYRWRPSLNAVASVKPMPIFPSWDYLFNGRCSHSTWTTLHIARLFFFTFWSFTYLF